MSELTSFGEEVVQEAQRLRATGLDANQIAGILCKKDPEGKNYGIGILLGRDGKPMPASKVLREYIDKELAESGSGLYLNSDAIKKDITEAVLRWQGVPEALWPNFRLLLPSDAGTGAVQTALQVAILYADQLKTLAVESLGWPAYRALAGSVRLGFKEFDERGVNEGAETLPLYQAGPMNTTGYVPDASLNAARASAAKKAGVPVILDRAYSGFEFARRLGASSLTEIMRESFATQVLPYTRADVPLCIALSPTKAFVTFSMRPCGFLLVYDPDLSRLEKLGPKLAGLIRARGSSFEHLVTRAFVKAFVKDRARLEGEHADALRRTAEAERSWERLTKGTAMESLFTEHYAGLFRNPKARPDAAAALYGAHLYPVMSEGRCRLNVTGLPADETQAAAHVRHFAQYCL